MPSFSFTSGPKHTLKHPFFQFQFLNFIPGSHDILLWAESLGYVRWQLEFDPQNPCEKSRCCGSHPSRPVGRWKVESGESRGSSRVISLESTA